jgi:hypothetical protein
MRKQLTRKAGQSSYWIREIFNDPDWTEAPTRVLILIDFIGTDVSRFSTSENILKEQKHGYNDCKRDHCGFAGNRCPLCEGA